MSTSPSHEGRTGVRKDVSDQRSALADETVAGASRIDRRPSVAVLTNILAPYRVPVIRRMGERFRTVVYVSGAEGNREAWAGTEATLGAIELRRSAGISMRVRRGPRATFDERFVHLPFGQVFDLIRLRPAAIITIEMGARTLLALLYGSLARIPVWIWWGGTLHTERSIGPIRRFVRAVVSRWARRWISYGATSTEYLTEIGVPRDRILQIQNCVDEGAFRGGAEGAERLSPEPVFLYVGQMIGRKGVDRLLHAAARLQDEGREFTLLLVGNGPERTMLASLAEHLGLENIHFRAAQPPTTMPAIYRSADFFVFPTLEDVWGLVVNEALWSGVPVLCSIHAGCAPELVPEAQRFDPDDIEELADRMRDAIEGRVGPPDVSVMRTCAEVGDSIVGDVAMALEGRRS